MPRAPKLCTRCPRTAVARGRCQLHAHVPFDGAMQRWRRDRPGNWESIRRMVIRRDRVCVLCQLPGNHVDHIVPVSRGGSWTPANLRLLCASCHRTKTAEEAADARRAS
ncbi:HNH endonuclease [Spirillospora sp. NPDC127200]